MACTIEQIMQEVAGIAFDHGPDGPRVGDRLRALELLSDWLENGTGTVEPVEIVDDIGVAGADDLTKAGL